MWLVQVMKALPLRTGLKLRKSVSSRLCSSRKRLSVVFCSTVMLVFLTGSCLRRSLRDRSCLGRTFLHILSMQAFLQSSNFPCFSELVEGMLSLVQVWTMLGPVGQLTHTTSHLPSFIPHPFFQADVAQQQYMCGYYFFGGHADCLSRVILHDRLTD